MAFFNRNPPPSQNYSSSGQYNQPQSYNGAPQVPYPWVSEWDARDNRWLFVNRETGQRTFEHPQQSYGGGEGNYQGGYDQGPARGYGQGHAQGYGQEYGAQAQRDYYQQEPKKESHTGRNVALGAAAGVLGGALLMHERHKVEEKWDDAKYAVEDDVADGVQDVEDFPENAARWTGEKVQDVEDIPQQVENKWDNAVDNVEDVPDDVAGWAGRKVGDVERFGDNIDDAYDEGRNDSRYDDDY